MKCRGLRIGLFLAVSLAVFAFEPQVFAAETTRVVCPSYLPDGIIENVSFNSEPGEFANQPVSLEGVLLRKQNAKATILICHGFSCDKSDFSCLRPMFANQPYNILIFDFRGHGTSSKDACCTFGRDEALDVLAASKFVKSDATMKNLPLISFGWSMGAVASVEAQAKDPTAFDALVLDSPFDSSDSVVKRGLDRVKVSLLGYNIPLPGRRLLAKYSYSSVVQSFLRLVFKFFVGFNTKNLRTWICKIKPSETIKKVKVPVFIVGCMNDAIIPVDSFFNVYKGAQGYKRFWLTNGRRHCDSFFCNPEKYGYKVGKFIKKVLNGEVDKVISGEVVGKINKITDDCNYKFGGQ